MIYPVYTLGKRGIRVWNDRIELGILRGAPSSMPVTDRVEHGVIGRLIKRLTGSHRMTWAEPRFEAGKVALEAVSGEGETARAALVLIRPEDIAPACSEAFVTLPEGAEILRLGFEDSKETIPNYLVSIPFGSAAEVTVIFGEPLIMTNPAMGHAMPSTTILRRERVVRIEASRRGVKVRETLFRPALESCETW